MEQLPHGDAARHALVSRLLTKYLYQVTPPYHFCYKFSPWKYSGVQTGNPQRVDEIVFPQSNQENVVLEEARMSRSQFIQNVSPRVIGSDWKSLSGHHVPSPMSSSTTSRTPITIATCPADVVSVSVP